MFQLWIFTNTWKTVIESQLNFWAVNVVAHVFMAAPQHLGWAATRALLMTLVLSNPTINKAVLDQNMDKILANPNFSIN